MSLQRDTWRDNLRRRNDQPVEEKYLRMQTERKQYLNQPLTEAEHDALQAHEAVIEKGLQTFVEVGAALIAIRDGKLYREQYGTFEAYCAERWNLTRRRAYQLIDASEVVGNLEMCTTVHIPENERQIRPLTVLEPEQQRAAWQEAVETAPNGKVTAAHVEAVAEKYKPLNTRPASIAPSGDIDDTLDSQIEPEDLHERLYVAGDEALVEVVDSDAPTPAPTPRAHVANNSGEQEWYTPREYIDAAREVMGHIDLDPASSDTANTVVRATDYFTVQDDGLKQQWRGNVWMNPPYSQPEINQFIDKLKAEYAAGGVSQACVLVNNATDTAWFHSIAESVTAVCFVRGRVKFLDAQLRPSGAPLQGQIVLYLGSNSDGFCRAFSRFGKVLYAR